MHIEREPIAREALLPKHEVVDRAIRLLVARGEQRAELRHLLAGQILRADVPLRRSKGTRVAKDARETGINPAARRFREGHAGVDAIETEQRLAEARIRRCYGLMPLAWEFA